MAAGMPNLYKPLKVPVLRQTCLPPIETNCIHDFINKTNDGTDEVWQIRMIESSVTLQLLQKSLESVLILLVGSLMDSCLIRRLYVNSSTNICKFVQNLQCRPILTNSYVLRLSGIFIYPGT